MALRRCHMFVILVEFFIVTRQKAFGLIEDVQRQKNASVTPMSEEYSLWLLWITTRYIR